MILILIWPFKVIWPTIINLSTEDIKNITDIIQNIVIVSATIFTARWTFKTFAHTEKIKELKELKILIMEYFFKMQLFCAQVREKEASPDEMKEKLILAGIHNKLAQLKETNLYTKKIIREEIQKVVGSWLTNSDRIKTMSDITGGEDRIKAWQEFEAEYKSVKDLIDDVANKLLF